MEFTEPMYRPPQEAGSLLLRATQSCTHNGCAFCYVSRGHRFLSVSPERMEREAEEAKAFFPPDARVYLTGSNPFALPAATLRSYLAAVRRHVPLFTEMSMQCMVRDIRGKNLSELKELRELGLRHVYVGVENGDDAPLALMNKGHSAAEAAQQLLRLEEAGIEYTAQYILGMGGKGKGAVCGEATARLFNRLAPRRIATTGLTVFEGTPLADMAREGVFVEASEKEKAEELLLFLERLTARTFFDSAHYLNMLNYRFATPDGNAAVIKDIQDLLATHSEEDLELTAARHMMRSV